MRDTIENIREKLRNNIYENEEHIRLSIVIRILDKLGWDIWDPSEVYPEFPVAPGEDQTRVDLALFSSSSTPSVFIEIKAIRKIETNLNQIERQLRDYNRNNTAIFSIITDGRLWRFYYSQTGGEFSNKCFKDLDLLEDDIDELELSFFAFLSKSEIMNGNARHDAKEYLQQSQIERLVNDVLPSARRMVNESPYPRLPQAVVQLVSEKGFNITEDEVTIIIEKLGAQKLPLETPLQPQEITVKTPVHEIKTKKYNEDYSGKKIKYYIFLGNKYYPKSCKEMFVNIANYLYEKHKAQYNLCTSLKSRKPYFSINKNDLRQPYQIDNSNYYLETNLNNIQKIKIIYNLIRIFGYKKSDLHIFTD